MKRYRLPISVISAAVLAVLVVQGGARGTVVDTYYEDFDGRQDDATIDGVDNWSVEQGSSSSVITQDSVTYSGGGKALQLTGAETAVNVVRSASYGDISPCWVKFMAKPGMGGQAESVPEGKIMALCFDYRGTIFVSDGSSWTDTGVNFTEGEWYTVALNLDFDSHTYDVYIEPTATPDTEFLPDKENLEFIDTSINSLSAVGFGGAYSTSKDDDTYIDDLLIDFIEKLWIITAPQALVVGEPSNPITLQLQNALSEVQTAWKDITLEVSSSSAGGTFSLDKEAWSPITQLIIPEGSQGVTFYYKDTKSGQPMIRVSEYPEEGWDDALQQVSVVTEAAYFDIAAVTPQVAGSYFDVTITAKDDFGGVNELYDGTVEIAPVYVNPATGTKVLIPGSVSGFSNGLLTMSLMYPDCGVIKIEVTDRDDTTKTGTSGEILFMPAAFEVEAGAEQVVNKEFNLKVTALNTLEKAAENYIGPAELLTTAVSPEAVSGAIISPDTLGKDDFKKGIAEIGASYNRWGTITITARDATYTTKEGTSDSIAFAPSAVQVEIEPPSGGKDFFYTGEDITVNISVIGADGVPIPNYEGSIAITGPLGLGLPASTAFSAEDKGSKTYTGSIDFAGTYSIRVTDTASGLTGSSADFDVKQATIKVISTTAPLGTTEVTIKIIDEDGNSIDDSSLEVLVDIEEEIPNNSSVSGALFQPLVFTEGSAKMWVSDSEAEIITIKPKTKYKFKIKKGTVQFGRVAKSGIGPLLWRELKE